MWASTVGIAVSKVSSLTAQFDGDIGLQVRRAQQIYLGAHSGSGVTSFLSRHIFDYLCTDNGAFFEIVRKSTAYGSRIVGVMHLDSLRCTRTGDPEIPVLYTDMESREHEMYYHQVVAISDMPNSSQPFIDTGFCAASRAYSAIAKMSVMELYLHEKISGSKPLAIHLASGVNESRMRDALRAADEEQVARGVVTYKGCVVIPVPGDGNIDIKTIPLAEIPDRFDPVSERRDAQLKYANAVGLDPQEVNPDLLASRAMGTGAQSLIIDQKSAGRGLASWRKQFTHSWNEWVTPPSVTFSFYDKDLRDQEQRATISKLRTDTVGILVDKGVITTQQAVQILVDQEELPKEFLSVDATPDETLSDEEKPLGISLPEEDVTYDEQTRRILRDASYRQIEEDNG